MGNHRAKILLDNGNHELLLSFLVLSDKRKDLLMLLRRGPKTLQEIRNSLEVTSSGIIPEIRKMEEKQLIYQMNREYALTEIGEVVAESMFRFEGILHIFSENTKFWGDHNISGIPEEFRLRLHELGKYEIVKSTATDIFRPQNEYMKNLLKAKWMKGISSVLLPEYPEYILNLAQKGVPVSVIVTRELLEMIKEKCKTELEKSKCYENVCIMVCDEKIEVGFAVTDFFISIRLFMNDGTYDFYKNILSFEKSAVGWGEDMFRHYEKISKRIRLRDL